jgi:glucosamine--fructose-6-phosphate aminotransferase (isomerizing)
MKIMCGIVGYVGYRAAFALITEGLTRLEYRGYDSAGVAVLADDKLLVRWTVGRVQNLLSGNGAQALPGHVGIGHTRWATHGKPSVKNAHPQVDCTGSIAVVHNGIIENHKELRDRLASRGHVFRSETDTEVVAHLVEDHLGGDLEDTIRKVMELLRGDYALGILSEHAPNSLAAARSGNPPLLIGIGEGEHFLSSDILSVAPYTQTILPLEEGELAVLTRDGAEIVSARGGGPARRTPVRVAWSPDEAELTGHSHFMHKEIHEQPSAIQRTFRHRVSTETAEVHLEGLSLTGRQLWDVNRMALVACGTSYHAGLIGRWFFESLARIPVDVDFSSEFRQRDLLLGPQDLCVFISQSGETADTLGALRAAKASGARALAVCNVPGSSLTRQADGVVLTSTGPEIGVASTKAFTAQIVALFLMALQAGRARGLVTADQARSLLKNLVGLPAQMEELLQEEERIAGLAAVFHWCRDFFFLGRGLYYPVALEGALKLKEIAYVRAEAFPAGEMKHGPLALVDRTTTTVVIAPAGRMYSKMVSTIEEVKAREGNVIALCTKGDEATLPLVDRTLPLPSTSDYLMPCLVAIPLQLFAYHMAVLRGCDVDRPRNLAKSVTVD